MTNLKNYAAAAAFIIVPAAVQADEDWTGFYAGLHVASTQLNGVGTKETTAVLGVHGGYDYDFGSFVLGGELSYASGANYTLGGVVNKSKTGRIKLRGGYDLGRTLVYAVVGYSSIDTGAGRLDGASYGLGVTYKVSDKVSLGAEYLIDDFSGSGPDIDGHAVSLRATYHF